MFPGKYLRRHEVVILNDLMGVSVVYYKTIKPAFIIFCHPKASISLGCDCWRPAGDKKMRENKRINDNVHFESN